MDDIKATKNTLKGIRSMIVPPTIPDNMKPIRRNILVLSALTYLLFILEPSARGFEVNFFVVKGTIETLKLVFLPLVLVIGYNIFWFYSEMLAISYTTYDDFDRLVDEKLACNLLDREHSDLLSKYRVYHTSWIHQPSTQNAIHSLSNDHNIDAKYLENERNILAANIQLKKDFDSEEFLDEVKCKKRLFAVKKTNPNHIVLYGFTNISLFQETLIARERDTIKYFRIVGFFDYYFPLSVGVTSLFGAAYKFVIV